MMVHTLDNRNGMVVGFDEETQMLLINIGASGDELEYRHYELKSPDGKTLKRFIKKTWNKVLRLSGEGVRRDRPRKFHMLERNEETDNLIAAARIVLRKQFRTNNEFPTAFILRTALKRMVENGTET